MPLLLPKEMGETFRRRDTQAILDLWGAVVCGLSKPDPQSTHIILTLLLIGHSLLYMHFLGEHHSYRPANLQLEVFPKLLQDEASWPELRLRKL